VLILLKILCGVVFHWVVNVLSVSGSVIVRELSIDL
jgi:hypothetical protein